MNLTAARRSVDYLVKLCLKESGSPEQIPFYPQKTRIPAPEEMPAMPKKQSPERAGVSSARLETLLRDLEEDLRTHLHNLLIYRWGRLILSASAPGYSPRVPSVTHSLAKSVTSLAVACLVGDGALSLSDRLVDIFRDELPPIVSRRMKRVTVRHLLTMTAGVIGVSETAAVTLEDWKRAFLSETPAYEPGSRFFYNSINSYMLSAVVEKVGGQPLEEVLKARIFTPLGITCYEIEKCPKGIAKGGWGMYLSPVDLGKLGLLLQAGGVWKGKQILPADYLREATTAQVAVDEKYGDYDYGYHLWIARDGSSFLMNGMLGQNVLIGRENGLVSVSTCGNDEFYQQSSTLRLIAAALKEPFPDTLLPSPAARRHLRRAEENFFCRRSGIPETGHHEDLFSPGVETPPPPEVGRLLGTYLPEKNNVGLLPLAWRIMQNNHAPGITRISLAREENTLVLTVTEGDESRRIPCGYDAYRYTTLTYREEPYLLGARCMMTENEDSVRLLRIDFVFPELPNARRLKIYLTGEPEIPFAFSEIPGMDLVPSILNSLIANAVKSGVYVLAQKHLSDALIRYRIRHCMEPILYAAKIDDPAGTQKEPVKGE